ncbi:MAG: hypothetical protein ACI4CC_09395 [Lachnospiraceae bacterium]
MTKSLEYTCKNLIEQHQYETCQRKICRAMMEEPHSAIPQNLMGILMEKEGKRVLAMKHFRAAYALDPTYVPARYNMEQYAEPFSQGKLAYTQEDCPLQHDPQFEVRYDDRHVGHLVRW